MALSLFRLFVACDIYRLAAIKQLRVVGKNANVPAFVKYII
ncbi:MAG: hypothetical protein K2O95_00865 [Clostridia bacterium]|nr:hypothetical protein [Clostridia bacterium]